MIVSTTAPAAYSDPPVDGRRFIQIEDTDEGPAVPRSEGARIQVGGLAQILAGSTPELPGGFRLRRLRATLDGQLEPTLRTQIFLEVDVTPESDLVARPLSEGFIAFDVASRSVANVGRLRMGQTKIGFGRELEVPAHRLPFVDRSLATRCLGPGSQAFRTAAGDLSLRQATGRDLGMRYDLHVDLPRRFSADATGGAYSGSGPNRVESSLGPLLLARVGAAWGVEDPARLRVAIGASYAQSDFDEVREGCGAPEPAILERVGTRRIGADFHLRWRWLTLDAELLQLRVDPASVPGGVPYQDGVGWFVSAGVFVLPDFAELTARLDRVTRTVHDQPATTPFVPGTDVSELTIGGNLRYYGDRFRLQYNWIQRSTGGFGSRGVVTISHVVGFTIFL